MMRRALLLTVLAVLVPIAPGETRADEPKPSTRGVFVHLDRVSPGFLAEWKSRGLNAVVVPLDETTRRRWRPMAEAVERAGMTLWPWIEVARNPTMADDHPEWMAAIGGHHDDWRRRFPDAPAKRPGEVIKAWPWVPIGYAPAFDAHRQRLKGLLGDLPGNWAGVFLNDLQAGPSSCGCGNDQCRWALDYGTAATAARTPGDDPAARLVAELSAGHPGKTVVPVWVTECERVDLPDATGGTGLCGRVPCASNDCWPRYARGWNPLIEAARGPIAVGVWPETFRRDAARWIESDLALFQSPPRGGRPLAPERTIAVIQAWGKSESAAIALSERASRAAAGWVLALDAIDQSWEPRGALAETVIAGRAVGSSRFLDRRTVGLRHDGTMPTIRSRQYEPDAPASGCPGRSRKR